MGDDVMNGSFGTATNATGFVPEVDVRSNDERVVFNFDLPGVSRDDIEITLENGVLTVKGARKFAPGTAKEQLVLGGHTARSSGRSRFPSTSTTRS